jgi:hypothetical protein
MTAAELEHIFKSLEIQAKDGTYSVSDGVSLTIHIASGGASLSVGRVEHVKVEGALIVAKTPKSQIAFHLEDVFAVGREGSGPEGRRPAGFGV